MHVARLHGPRLERPGAGRGAAPTPAWSTRSPYLRDLGVTAVELLPVFALRRRRTPPPASPTSGATARSPGSRRTRATAATARPLAPVDEFRDLVKALHRGRPARDPGRRLQPHRRGRARRARCSAGAGFADATTTCTTATARATPTSPAAATPSTRTTRSVSRLILDSLRYWVREMHVDGFRFDLGVGASRAARTARRWSGRRCCGPSETDPELAGTTLIAEAWDAGGLYQVGDFPGERFAQWNGRFRDDVRRFWRGDDGDDREPHGPPRRQPRPAARRRGPAVAAVNFVTCHDGFTPARPGLLRPQAQRGQRRGQPRRHATTTSAGTAALEGPTDDPVVAALRARQVRNFLA